eukprot:365144-Chlamydomonas_euryale.AAC.3
MAGTLKSSAPLHHPHTHTHSHSHAQESLEQQLWQPPQFARRAVCQKGCPWLRLRGVQSAESAAPGSVCFVCSLLKGLPLAAAVQKASIDEAFIQCGQPGVGAGVQLGEAVRAAAARELGLVVSVVRPRRAGKRQASCSTPVVASTAASIAAGSIAANLPSYAYPLAASQTKYAHPPLVKRSMPTRRWPN